MSIYYLPPNALAHLPADIHADQIGDGNLKASLRATAPATVYDADTGGALADPGDAIGRIEDGTANGIDLKQSNASLRPVFGRKPVTGRRNLAPVSEPTVSDLNASGNVVNGDFGGSLGLQNGIYFADNAALRFAYVSLSAVPNTTYCLSVFIKMDDGLAPVLGADNASGDLRLVLYSTTTPNGLTVEDLGAGVYRISGVLAENTSDPFFGVVKYTTQSARGFTITGYQVEVGDAPTDYQKADASGFDVTEESVETVHYASFDLIDDKLASDTITGGIAGQAFVAGAGGCYITDLTVADGGTFEIGRLSPTLLDTWTDAPINMLPAVASVDEQVFDALLRSGNFTDEEIARLEAYYIARGGKGLLVEGPELESNGTFDTDTSGWSSVGQCTLSVVSGAMRVLNDDPFTAGASPFAQSEYSTEVGAIYKVNCEVTAVSIGLGGIGVSASPNTTARELVQAVNAGVGLFQLIFKASSTTTYLKLFSFSIFAGASADFDNVSVKKLTPREEL